MPLSVRNEVTGRQEVVFKMKSLVRIQSRLPKPFIELKAGSSVVERVDKNDMTSVV